MLEGRALREHEDFRLQSRFRNHWSRKTSKGRCSASRSGARAARNTGEPRALSRDLLASWQHLAQMTSSPCHHCGIFIAQRLVASHNPVSQGHIREKSTQGLMLNHASESAVVGFLRWLLRYMLPIVLLSKAAHNLSE